MILPICPDCGNIFKYEPIDEAIQIIERFIKVNKSEKIKESEKSEIISRAQMFLNVFNK